MAPAEDVRHLKRKRSENELDRESAGEKRRKSSPGPVNLVATMSVVTVVDQEFGEAYTETGLGERAKRPIDENWRYDNTAKRRRTSTAAAQGIEVIDLTLPNTGPTDSVETGIQQGLKEVLRPYTDGSNLGTTRFDTARRYFLEKGTAVVSEDGHTEDVVRALRLVRRLEKQATETPEQAMRRMKSKSRRLIRSQLEESHKPTHDHLKRQPWIAPNRLDNYIHETPDNPEYDKWSSGDEAATQGVERQADDVERPKRKRRTPWLEQRGWDTDRMIELLGGAQAAMIDEAKEGLEKKQWDQYKVDNPNWQEEEAKQNMELKKQRKERREAAKKREEEMKKNGQAVGPVKRGLKGTAAGSQSKKADAGDKTNSVDNKAITADDAADAQEAENAPEPEGEFDINDWASDGDEDEYVYEDDDA